MKRLGIHTGADLKAQTLEFLQEHFGKSGPLLPCHRPRPGRPPGGAQPAAQVGRLGDDLPAGSRRRPRSRQGVASVLEDVWSYCEKNGIAGRTVTVKIKYADFQIVTRSRTLLEPACRQGELERISVELVRSIFPLEKRVRLLGVSLAQSLSARTRPRRRHRRLDAGPAHGIGLGGDLGHHLLQHRRVGIDAEARLHIVPHVLGLAGAGDDAGHGRIGQHELQQDLRPARAADLARPVGQLAAESLRSSPPPPNGWLTITAMPRSAASGSRRRSTARSSSA